MDEYQSKAISLLYGDVLRFCREQASADWSRGRKSLYDAIRQLELSGIGAAAAPFRTPAMRVQPSRVALPTLAGICDPLDHLPPRETESLERC